MITAVEKGRNLIITVGDDEENVQFIIKPLPTSVGGELLAQWASVIFGQAEEPEQVAADFSKLAIGAENWDAMDALRWAEGEKVINAAFMWNVQGGGLDVVQELLGAGGFPKARDTLLARNGLSEGFSLLQTLLDGESESRMNALAATPGTTTQPGISSNSESTVARLPMSRRSIRQNQG